MDFVDGRFLMSVIARMENSRGYESDRRNESNQRDGSNKDKVIKAPRMMVTEEGCWRRYLRR